MGIATERSSEPAAQQTAVEASCKFAAGWGDAEDMTSKIPAQAQPFEHPGRGETRLLAVHTEAELVEKIQSLIQGRKALLSSRCPK